VGGVETFIKHVDRYTDSSRFINIYLLFQSGPLADYLQQQGARLELASSPPKLSKASDRGHIRQKMRDLINEHSVDLVHSLGPEGALLSAPVCRQLNVPHIWFQYYPQGWIDSWAALSHHQGLIVSSHHAAEQQRQAESWIRFLIKRQHPIEKILLGTDIKPISESLREAHRNQLINKLNLNPQDLVLIGSIGRILPRKGLEVLLEAIGFIHQKEPHHNIHSLIWGPFSEQDKYHQRLVNRIKERRLPVTLMGLSEDVSLSHGICDVHVNASIEPESFSHAVIEAMATGLPPIVPESGAFPELIKNGQNGLTFKSGNHLSLANRLKSLIKDKNLRTQISQEAIKTVRLRHNSQTTIQHLEQFYDKVLQRN
jgi:glycosyltransferase involved in cell wall biosynthesis